MREPETGDVRLQKLVAAVTDLNEISALSAALDMSDDGVSAYAIFEALLEGIRQVDARYESGEYFIADLIMAGHIMRSVMETAFLFPEAEISRPLGRVLSATVSGDIHDLGKQAVIDVLRHNGFRVTDLGVDVPEARVAEAAAAEQPDILILSGTLSESVESMRRTIALVRAAEGPQPAILVGGAAVKELKPESLGADRRADSVLETLQRCHELMAFRAGGR